MHRAGACLLLVYAALSAPAAAPSAQAIADLHATLLALKEARVLASSLSQRLTADVMAIATGNDRPSRGEPAPHTPLGIADLSRETGETDIEAALQQRLVDIVRVPGSTNLDAAQRLRGVLTRLRINDSESNLLIRRFLAIGESVRGPDHSPLAKE